MKFRAGERLKAMREMIGITREEFADILKLDFIRLKNIEQKRCRMGEEEFERIGEMFPEMMPWLTYEGGIIFDDLQTSQEKLCRLIAAKIDADQLPEGFDLKDKIVK